MLCHVIPKRLLGTAKVKANMTSFLVATFLIAVSPVLFAEQTLLP